MTTNAKPADKEQRRLVAMVKCFMFRCQGQLRAAPPGDFLADYNIPRFSTEDEFRQALLKARSLGEKTLNAVFDKDKELNSQEATRFLKGVSLYLPSQLFDLLVKRDSVGFFNELEKNYPKAADAFKQESQELFEDPWVVRVKDGKGATQYRRVRSSSLISLDDNTNFNLSRSGWEIE